MHVVIDARILETTTGRYCQGLLEGLASMPEARADIRYTILAPSKSLADWQKLYGDLFNFVACDIKNYSLAEQFKLKRVLEELKPDLVHFCMPQQPIFYKASPVITTFHDLTLMKTYNSDKNWLIFHLKQMVGKWVFARALAQSRVILTPSEYTRDDILKTFWKRAKTAKPVDSRFLPSLTEKIFTVYLAGKLPKTPDIGQKGLTFRKKYDIIKIDPEEGSGLVLPDDKEKMPKNYILYVGNQADYKNIPRLMEAEQKLLEEFPDLYLVLASPPGKATEKNRELARKQGYRNIIFTGWLTSDELKKLYKNCRCYCFPSLMEGFGLPGLEAMGMGAPVAAADATSLPEVYGEAAIYFDPMDSGDMAAKIRQVLTDDNLRDDLVEHGKKQFEKYSWVKTAEETLQHYMYVLKSE